MTGGSKNKAAKAASKHHHHQHHHASSTKNPNVVKAESQSIPSKPTDDQAHSTGKLSSVTAKVEKPKATPTPTQAPTPNSAAPVKQSKPGSRANPPPSVPLPVIPTDSAAAAAAKSEGSAKPSLTGAATTKLATTTQQPEPTPQTYGKTQTDSNGLQKSSSPSSSNNHGRLPDAGHKMGQGSVGSRANVGLPKGEESGNVKTLLNENGVDASEQSSSIDTAASAGSGSAVVSSSWIQIAKEPAELAPDSMSSSTHNHQNQKQSAHPQVDMSEVESHLAPIASSSPVLAAATLTGHATHVLPSRLSRGPSGAATPERFVHSYDKYFSTSLTKLSAGDWSGARSPLRRIDSSPESLAAQQHAGEPGSPENSENLTPLLLRTGSRMWEDIQETKGQGWLSARQSSTNLYELVKEVDSSDEDEYSRIRNMHNPRSTLNLQEDEEYNPLSVEIDKGFLEAEHPETITVHENPEEISEADPGSGLSTYFKPSHNMILEGVDWLLGVGQEAQAFLAAHPDDPALARVEKIQRVPHTDNSITGILALGILSFAI